MVPGGGVEPPRYRVPADFESAASANSAIPAWDCKWLLLNMLLQLYRDRSNLLGLR